MKRPQSRAFASWGFRPAMVTFKRTWPSLGSGIGRVILRRGEPSSVTARAVCSWGILGILPAYGGSILWGVVERSRLRDVALNYSG